jgi:hypothetical protein
MIWSWSYLGHAGLKCFEFITSSNVLPHTTLISKGPVVFPFRPCRFTAGAEPERYLRGHFGVFALYLALMRGGTNGGNQAHKLVAEN